MLSKSGFPCFRSASYRFAAVCLYCALLLGAAQAHAEDWYQVEVALFRFTKPDTQGEWWRENPGLPAREQTIALVTETIDPEPEAASGPLRAQDLRPYHALPGREHRLAGVRRALARSEDYQPLLHVAWRQPGLAQKDVRAVRLSNILLQDKAEKQADTEATEAGGMPEYTPPVKVFDGAVRLRKSRFLHLDVDFAWFPETLEQPGLSAPEAEGGRSRHAADYVRLRQSRRIKIGQLNYFDHPLFGLIVQVSRLEIAEPDSAVFSQ